MHKLFSVFALFSAAMPAFANPVLSASGTFGSGWEGR